MDSQSFWGPGIIIHAGKPVTVVTQFITSDGSDNRQLKEICHKQAYGDTNDFEKKRGLKGLGASVEAGMVLVLSLWDDHDVNMLWFDSIYQTDSGSKAGADRDPCVISSGDRKDVENNYASASVTFSDIKFGSIDSTY
jgi:cellulose 1,4-beta-cellobiosidase